MLNINQITLAWLNSARGISGRTIEKLIEYFGSPEDIWIKFEEEIFKINILKSDTIKYLIDVKDVFEEKLNIQLEKENAGIVTYLDDCYPYKLKNINGFPKILYYKGSLNNINDISIAVVGSRKATSYGKWVAEKFVKELSILDVNIVSGLAWGIDTAAHKAALKYKTKTIGVIGCGIDRVYPSKNQALYKEIAEKGGAVITEFPFGMSPVAANFPIRNRIISGLCDGVLVVEAQEKSGTLITAGHAADQGREIFAVPGNIDSLYSKGTNALIKDGAKITTCIEDIANEILELKLKLDNNKRRLSCDNLSEKEKKIVKCLSDGEKNIAEMEITINMKFYEILSTLSMLEIKGIVSKIRDNEYILNSKL